MIKFRRANIGPGVFEVFLGEAVPCLPINANYPSMEKRSSIIGNVVLVLRQIAQSKLRRGAESEGNGWRKTVTLVLGEIAFCHIVAVCHQIQTQSGIWRDHGKRLINVNRPA